jgi:dTDP-4-amino-4,6-dideoxygalactose transaminase
VFHYVPLHSSPAGRRYGRAHGDLSWTNEASSRLLRLPIWAGMDDSTVTQVIDAVQATFSELSSPTADARFPSQVT